jgi:hypothetical protein
MMLGYVVLIGVIGPHVVPHFAAATVRDFRRNVQQFATW